MRRAAKTDSNQAEIMDALRKIGVTVEYIKQPFDLLICHKGETALMECKTKEGRFTKQQLDFISRWPGKIHVVRSAEEAVRSVLGEEVMR